MATPDTDTPADTLPTAQWLTPGVRGVGVASLLSDIGQEVLSALLPAFLATTLGAPAAVLGLIEGIADGLAGITRFAGGPLADDPDRRRSVAVGGYAATAILSALIGLATAAWQVGLLRAGAWAARGLRQPSRNALLADAVDATAYGRAYGFERAMDNLGAVLGPLLALGLVALTGVRQAILLSVIPGLLAAVAIYYAVRHIQRPRERRTAPLRFVVRPLMRGPLGRLLVAVALFEAGNVAATMLILRATELLTPGRGAEPAAAIAIGLYVIYNAAATLAATPAGHLSDRRGPRPVFGAGVGLFGLAYAAFALVGPSIVLVGGAFALSGVAIGAVETAEHAAVAGLAPADQRGSAFGLLAGIQSLGDFAASAVIGLVWTLASPAAAFGLAAAVMVAALGVLVVHRPHHS